MHIGRLVLSLATALLMGFWAAAATSPAPTFGAPPPGRIRSGEVLVLTRPGAEARSVARRAGASLVGTPASRTHRLRVQPGREAAAAALLQRDPDVLAAAPSYVRSVQEVTPNDPMYPQQWWLPKIDAPAAWSTTTGSPSVKVAVLDSGVELTHPDLSPNIADGTNTLGEDPQQVAEDGCANTTTVQDDFGHGTHVSGIVAAVGNNAVGVAGVAWNVRILPVKVLDCTGNGSDAQIIAGIDWAIANGAQVINMSLGGPGDSPVLDAAVQRAWNAGLVVVAAAGNGATNVPYYPAASPGAIAVSATDPNDQLAPFSNYGSDVALSAPGTSVLSTWTESSYRFESGTSMASPMVAGSAALLLSAHPEYDNGRVLGVLFASASKPTICPGATSCAYDATGRNDYFGHGRVDLARALRFTNASYLPRTPLDSAGGF
ncbi:MAG TPA: S8 family peptidase [Chloroflexota bacterium]|nr:S8 family peptidase [Chloroflexota bacterium]